MVTAITAFAMHRYKFSLYSATVPALPFRVDSGLCDISSRQQFADKLLAQFIEQ